MAGNIVKWWKHKILGGYKQFSVLQECTTDSEELMYPVRAPSSCSAPPDLLLVSDRENVQIKTPVNIISTSKVHHSQHHQKQHQSQQQHHHHQQQQQQHQQQQHHHHQQQKDVQQMMKQAGHNNNNNNNNHKNTETATAATNHRVEGSHQKNDDQRMHLEEFTCDVSVEGGKSSQPLQFSFTFYDLDGHHGKITKDDIVGIVYTIYESIGKSVVVPHCGSKTINVRLTVSPEGKSKSSAEKLKKNHSSAPGSQQQQQPPYQQQQQLQQQQQQQQQQQHSRRQHRYRPRKLIKSDDEEDDADSGSEKEISNNKKTPTASTAAATTASKFNKLNVEGGGGGGGSNQKFYCPDIRVSSSQDQSPHLASRLMDNSQHSGQSTSQQTTTTNSQATPNNIKYPTATENIYESMANLKCCPKESRKAELDGCKECAQSSFITSHQQYLKQASTRAKILRKARKQKYQEQCYESRQRSLSVGNESCWKFRSDRTGQDDVDGRALPSSAECWNNALKRNDLIDIIRESMEKNRLCFQSNGKTQPNVSPIIRHRQRSNTISKMHDENYQQQTSHHIPIYHQQMAINPAILSQNNGILHPKTNLCGYDSFLHATICSTINNTTAVSQQQQQQSLVPNQTTNLLNSPKIYVNNNNCNLGGKNNKILNRNIGYHSQQNSPQFHGYQRLSSSHSGGAGVGDAGAAKLNTSLLNSLNPQLSAEEKLNRTIDHVEKWLSERDQGMLKVNDLKALKYSTDEHKCKKDVKNYDNFLYAKLTEKLQEIPRKGNNQDNCLNNDNSNNNNNNNNSNINNNKENIRRSHHSHNYQQKLHRRHTGLSPSSSAPAGSLHKAASGTGSTSGNNKFINLIPVDIVDPIECENLLHPTSDEDTVPQTPTPSVGGGGGDVPPRNQAAGNSNNGNNSTTSSSMIHRYVHEHIHHHYHHFENKDG